MTIEHLPHLAQRLFNRPLAILPDKAEMVMAVLADRLGIAELFVRDGRAVVRHRVAGDLAALQAEGLAQPRARKVFDLVDGVALIPVEGTLVNKLGSLDPYWGMTGYDGLRVKIFAALEDPDVQAILLDIDSPGGEVAGCFDLVDDLYAARGAKPVWAMLSEYAYSAAYAIASACDRICVPRTGGVGSVGVCCLHVDFSAALAKDGIKVTLITAGTHKADGNPYEPLPPDVRDRVAAEIEEVRTLFVATVARNRKLSPAAVRATEALTYPGRAGIEAGLADEVLAPDKVLGKLLDTLNRSAPGAARTAGATTRTRT